MLVSVVSSPSRLRCFCSCSIALCSTNILFHGSIYKYKDTHKDGGDNNYRRVLLPPQLQPILSPLLLQHSIHRLVLYLRKHPNSRERVTRLSLPHDFLHHRRRRNKHIISRRELRRTNHIHRLELERIPSRDLWRELVLGGISFKNELVILIQQKAMRDTPSSLLTSAHILAP